MHERPVRLEMTRDFFTFSAAHFAQLGNGNSEPLHGHNYNVRVAITGTVDANGFVIDFGYVKPLIRQITARFNHKILVPLRQSKAHTPDEDENLHVAVDNKSYSFPRDEVAILDICNTTVECLSMHIADVLVAELQKLNPQLTNIHDIEVTVEESAGQSATSRRQYKNSTAI